MTSVFTRDTLSRYSQVLLVDDHELARIGLRSLVLSAPELEICGEAGDDTTARRLIVELQPNLVLLEVLMDDCRGLELIKWIAQTQPTTKTLVVTTGDERVFGLRVLRAGARGYISKNESAQSILAAIGRVLKGNLHFSEELKEWAMQVVSSGPGPPRLLNTTDTLSDRELEIFRMIGLGHSTDQIAASLHLSVNTVSTYRERLKKKLHVKCGNELTRTAMQWILDHN